MQLVHCLFIFIEAPDGSYLYRKQHAAVSFTCDEYTIPTVPLIGWEPIDNSMLESMKKIPKVTLGKFVMFKCVKFYSLT